MCAGGYCWGEEAFPKTAPWEDECGGLLGSRAWECWLLSPGEKQMGASRRAAPPQRYAPPALSRLTPSPPIADNPLPLHGSLARPRRPPSRPRLSAGEAASGPSCAPPLLFETLACRGCWKGSPQLRLCCPGSDICLYLSTGGCTSPAYGVLPKSCTPY